MWNYDTTKTSPKDLKNKLSTELVFIHNKLDSEYKAGVELFVTTGKCGDVKNPWVTLNNIYSEMLTRDDPIAKRFVEINKIASR